MTKFLMSFLLLSGLVWANQSSSIPPVKTVPSVDLNRYLGKWYQIAAIPQFFERNCYSDTAADYSLTPDNDVVVHNTCTNIEGNPESAMGRAKVKDKQTNAKLKVTFLKFGTWWYLFGGNYWILELDPDYRWVVVGEGSRKYGWILARESSLSESDLKMISAKIKDQGYDTCEFITARQQGGFLDRKPLCEVL